MNEKAPRQNNSFAARYLAGSAAGLVAALAMTLAMLLLRLFFGTATAPELVGDRIAPLLSVNTFLSLLDRAGGYNQLKQIGVVSVIAGHSCRRARRVVLCVPAKRARRSERTDVSVSTRGCCSSQFLGELGSHHLLLGLCSAARGDVLRQATSSPRSPFSYGVFWATRILSYGAWRVARRP